MFNRITIVALLIMSLWFTSADSAFASDANSYISAGRADMFTSPPLSLPDLRLAYQHFNDGLNDQSCSNCNSSQELIFFHAATKTAMLFIDNNDVSKDSFFELLKQFGVTVTGDTFESLHSNVSMTTGCYKIPSAALTAASDIIPKLIDDADTIIAELDSINDTNFKVIFHPAETGLASDIEVDYGEVLILKGFVAAIKSQLEAKQAYNVFINNTGKIKTVLDAMFCDTSLGSNFTFSLNNDLLTPYPNFLRVLPTNGAAILAQSREDLIDSIDYYLEALNYLKAESILPGNHMIYIDPNDTNDKLVLDLINAQLTAFRDSLKNDTVATYRLETAKTFDIYDDSNSVIGQLAFSYTLPTEFDGRFTFTIGGVPSYWNTWLSLNSYSDIEAEVESFQGGWTGGSFNATLSPDGNSFTNGTFEYWGDYNGSISGLSGHVVSTENQTIRVDLNPVYGASARYPHPVSPRNLLPLFNARNEPVSGTFGHGLGNDATLGGILPDMTQQQWVDWIGLARDDIPTISLTALDNQASENGDTGTVRISREYGNMTNPVIVHFTRGGTAVYGSGVTGDYTLSGNGLSSIATSVVIPADANYVDITVTPVDNLKYEPNETVILTLTANAAYVLTATFPQRTATVTILDNEPVLSITATDNQAAENALGDTANPGTFRITRVGSTANALTVNFTHSGTAVFGAAGDYTLSTALATSVVIPTGQASVDITVTPVDNLVAEPNETVILTLVANAAYKIPSVVAQRSATVTILDNEPVLSITATDNQAAETALGETANPGTFRITRVGSTANPVTVHFTRGGTAVYGSGVTGDYTLSGNGLSSIATSVVIPADANYVDITVTPVDNLKYEPNETVILTLTANAAYVLTATFPQRTATVTILDNEPVLSITATDNQAAENALGDTANPGTFRITRVGSTANALTVNFTHSGTAVFGAAGDYTLSTALATSVVIPTGQASVDITVTPVDNLVAEPNETVILTLVANAAYKIPSVVAQRSATVTILDNEPVLSITATDNQAAETALGETANPGTFRITRVGSTANPVTVHFTRGGTAVYGSGVTGDYTLSGNGLSSIATSVVIPADANYVDITVTPVDNLKYEPNETVILTLTANAAYKIPAVIAQRSATVAIVDND